jgi:hypothetical protein
MRFVSKWLICALAVVVLAGCNGATQYLKRQFTDQEPPLVTPQRTPMELPDHAKLAVAGLLQKMRHQKPRGVSFDPKGSHDVGENFDYAGFSVRSIDVAKDVTIKENSKAAIIDLGGFMHFVDKDARATTVGFEVAYKIMKNGAQPPLILQSYTSNAMPAYPVVASFLVPADTFIQDRGKRPGSFGELLQFAQRYGIDTRATKEDVADRKAREGMSIFQKAKLTMTTSTSKEQELISMTFCFDRLSPASTLDLTVNGSHVEPLTLDFDGWRVLVLGGKGRLFAPSAAFTVDVYYRKNSDTAFSGRHIGKFSSLKYFPEDHQSAPTTVAKAPGPIEKGQYRLDISKYEDACTVQARLKELGYYTKKVDGEFGNGSKAAFNAWCRNSMGRDTGSLTLALQKELFKGTGR